MALTTIKIQTETREKLADLGKKSESYDTIINRLIDFYQKRPKKD
jgi:predicted CopG family antitoxin